MNQREARLSREKLLSILDYDPETGVFKWKMHKCSNRIGLEAGTNTRGYVQICIGKRGYLAHRLAWLYVYGYWPVGDVDHINTVRHDNRLVNLRVVTKQENNRNVKRKSHNSTGYKGVCFYKENRFIAYITVNYKTKYLGVFDTAEEASAAYAAASQLYHGDYGRPA